MSYMFYYIAIVRSSFSNYLKILENKEIGNIKWVFSVASRNTKGTKSMIIQVPKYTSSIRITSILSFKKFTTLGALINHD